MSVPTTNYTEATVRTGLLLTDNIEATRAVEDVQDEIFLLQRNVTPLLSVMNAIKHTKDCTQPEYSWWSDDSMPRVITVKTGIDNAVTTLPVVAGDAIKVHPGNVLVNTRTSEHFRVSAVDTTGPDSNTLTILRGFGTTAGTAMLALDKLVILAPAIPEGSDATTLTTLTTVMTKSTNYAQIFWKKMDASGTRIEEETYGGPDRAYQWGKLGSEMKKDMEFAYMLGEPREVAIGGRLTWATGGLNYWLDHFGVELDMEGMPLDKSSLDKLCELVFEFDPGLPNPDERLFLASPAIISQIAAWAEPYQMVDPTMDGEWGIRVVSYNSPHGVLKIARAPLLKGALADRGFIVNPNDFWDRPMRGRNTKFKQNAQVATLDGVIDYILRQSGFELHYPQIHARIINCAV